MQRIDPTGMVALQGTLWTARNDTPIEAGETIRVIAVDGLKLTAARVTEET